MPSIDRKCVPHLLLASTNLSLRGTRLRSSFTQTPSPAPPPFRAVRCLMSVSMHRPLPHSLPPLHYTLATSLSPLASRPRGAETMTFWRPVFISRIPVTRERVWPILRILAPKPREREIFSSGPKKLQKSPPPPRVPETDFSSLAGLDGGLSLLDRTKNSTTKKTTRGTEKSERVCFERDF